MKHITSAEANPTEAVETNVGGAKNVVRALAGGNKPCVFVSTDKAVEPLNVYGMTKAIQDASSNRAVRAWGSVRQRHVVQRVGRTVLQGVREGRTNLAARLARHDALLPDRRSGHRTDS